MRNFGKFALHFKHLHAIVSIFQAQKFQRVLVLWIWCGRPGGRDYVYGHALHRVHIYRFSRRGTRCEGMLKRSKMGGETLHHFLGGKGLRHVTSAHAQYLASTSTSTWPAGQLEYGSNNWGN